jgi:transaldolase/glucose-6-phosphate isomerase
MLIADSLTAGMNPAARANRRQPKGDVMPGAFQAVQQLGQSIWLDNIRRGFIASGDLRRLVDEGLMGLTSNPAIFEKAILGSNDYDAAIRRIVCSQMADRAIEVYEQLAVEDIQMAADVLRTVYNRTEGRDGFVSLEVSPHLAHDGEATVAEAHRLHAAVDRPNLMIKVPATEAGVPAIRQLIADGICVNVTLLFAVDSYEKVANAYLQGLEDRVARGTDIRKLASVASFFVSRIDTLVDGWLEKAAAECHEPRRKERLLVLRGQVAIANAKIAYERFRSIVSTPRWKTLAAKGGNVQRLLWASTSTKNPRYSKTLYVDALIGPDTVNTLPPETIEAFRHAKVTGPTLTTGLDDARQLLAELASLGVSLSAATDQLLVEAVRKFAEPFDKLMTAIDIKRQALLPALA